MLSLSEESLYGKEPARKDVSVRKREGIAGSWREKEALRSFFVRCCRRGKSGRAGSGRMPDGGRPACRDAHAAGQTAQSQADCPCFAPKPCTKPMS